MHITKNLEELFNLLVSDDLGGYTTHDGAGNDIACTAGFVFERFASGDYFLRSRPVNGRTEISLMHYDYKGSERQVHDGLFEEWCEQRFTADHSVPDLPFFVNYRDFVESKGIAWADHIGVTNVEPITDAIRVESLAEDYFEIHGSDEFYTVWPTFSSYLTAHGL